LPEKAGVVLNYNPTYLSSSAIRLLPHYSFIITHYKMATSLKNLSDYSQTNLVDVSAKKFAIVVAEWNAEVTEALFTGAYQTLLKRGAKKKILSARMCPAALNLL
jgi:hypothetical protein